MVGGGRWWWCGGDGIDGSGEGGEGGNVDAHGKRTRNIGLYQACHKYKRVGHWVMHGAEGGGAGDGQVHPRPDDDWVEHLGLLFFLKFETKIQSGDHRHFQVVITCEIPCRH